MIEASGNFTTLRDLTSSLPRNGRRFPMRNERRSLKLRRWNRKEAEDKALKKYEESKKKGDI